MKHGWRIRLRTAACLLSLGLCAAGNAASLQVSPTSVTLQARQSADGLTLTNTGTAPLHAQVRVFRWTQQGDEEKLEPTRDIAISPPMLQLAPGAQQLVRVIRLGPPPSDVQTSYRLIVDELPVDAGEAKPGLQFVLQYSVPVFLMPQGDAAIAHELHARVVREGDRSYIAISNAGKAHAQIAELAYAAADGTVQTVAAGLSGYVLPGNTKRWPLPATVAVSDTGTFKARINGEPVVQTLPLDPAAR